MPKNYYYRSLYLRLNEEVDSIVYDQRRNLFLNHSERSGIIYCSFLDIQILLIRLDPILCRI